ncbi:TBC1 domain family member 5-like A [Spatholobus suberectus]|nr:TBC1 domain family member 5-like A [Spatholobus suberectus]
MPPALMDPPLPESSSVPALRSDSVSPGSAPESRRFGDLRGLQWRMNLGVLPSSSSSSSSIDDLRRATANSRRRYASLRGRLLVDPHIPKDGSSSPDLVMDNPLSQNPDSTWSRFFHNAEMERMVDQDLSRLYPEHGNYFQTPGCQGILRRILLLWCLRHPECGYRQGMHELLAPVLYVLQFDVECLSEVRKLYEDHFTDRFDDLICQENDLSYSFDFRKSSDMTEDEIDSNRNAVKIKSLDELDPKIQNIVLLSDAYGAEGELGVVLSEKFIEHDAYCMFDALMNGACGSIAMANFFSYSPLPGSHTGLPPVIEASAALYHLLSHVDSSLHGHLIDLGVEPQYFALRWLRVLFGREFSLSNLLIIWDEIFLSVNSKVEKHAEDNADSGFRILHSSRGAFIAAMAVAMMLHLRSSLLAAENPTTCLQRLLNFPEDTNVEKLIEKAKSLQALALSAEISSSTPSFVEHHNQGKSVIARSCTLSSESISPKTPLNLVPDSYWEEKWRVVHKAEELKQDGAEKQVPTRKKGWTDKVKFSLKRTESDPSSSKIKNGKKESKASVRHSLLEDLSKELGFEEDTEKLCCHANLSATVEEEQRENGSEGSNNYSAEDRCLSRNTSSEENSPVISCPSSPPNEANDCKNDSEKSSVGSNLSLDEINETSLTSPIDSPLPISDHPENVSQTSGSNNINNSAGNSTTHSKERKLNKFQWLWKFGQNNGEFISEKGGEASEAVKPANNCNNQSNTIPSSTANGHCSSVSCKGESTDQNVMGTLRNIGRSMLEHIQVIECAFQQDQGQGTSLDNMSKNVLVGKGQVTAMSALEELRKISNLLSEM